MIILQQPAQPPATDDRSVAPSYRGGWEEQQIAHALMVAFAMIVLHELANGSPERPFTDENHAVQTRFLDGPYEALRVRVEIRGTGRQADHLHACGGECLAERQR